MATARTLPAIVLALTLAACAPPPPRSFAPDPAEPRLAASGAEAAEYGSADGYPLGNRSTFFRAARPSALARATSVPDITYTFQETRTLGNYLARHPTTGLLVARGDTILLERYQYGRTDRQRFTSWSMGKTITSMLVGIAIAEGRIRSVDDPAEHYVPELAGTEYGRTSATM